MAYKFNKIKSIKKGLIGPNILFPAAYLLFSAEVCTGGAKNKPTNQMGRTLSSLAAKPVAHLDKIEEGMERSKDNTEALAAGELVDPLDKIEEDIEESEGNTEALAAGESVDPLDKKEEGVEGSKGNTEALIAAESVDPSKVDTNCVNVPTPPVASAGVGVPVAPPASVVSAGVGTPPPPPPAPVVSAGVGTPPPPPPAPVVSAGVGTPPPGPVASKIVAEEIEKRKSKHKSDAFEKSKIRILSQIDSSYNPHEDLIGEIMKKECSSCGFELVSCCVRKILEASGNIYGYSKEDVLKWFFNQPNEHITEGYHHSILNLILEQVQGNEAAYDSKKVSLLKLLTEKID
ncbi:hypothetical protein [Candidatus Cardinium hertigii]|uniref:hypothetical protein n=1 Tax=Candidatus Cardinium hertigii TaxID=247481 RepID=UPI003D7E3876